MSRFDYVRYDQESIAQQEMAKAVVSSLEQLIDDVARSTDLGSTVTEEMIRSRQKALDALEECYMWIGKLVRNTQLQRLSLEKLPAAPLQEERVDS